MTVTLASFTHLPSEVQKHLKALETYIGDTDGKDTVLMTDGNTCIDDGTIDAGEAVTAFNGIVAALTAALSGEVVVRRGWLADVRDQMMKMKLESGPAGDFIFLLREMLTDILDRPAAAPPPSSTAGEGK